MNGLTRAWLTAQEQTGEMDAPALLKTANGLEEITQGQLQQLIAQLQPGQSIVVGGIQITLSEDGYIQTSSTRPPEMGEQPVGQMTKSAGYGRREPSFGAALQGLWVLSLDDEV